MTPIPSADRTTKAEVSAICDVLRETGVGRHE